MRLGQVVDLRDAVAEPDAEDAAGAHPDQRLHRLEARALRILPGIEEAEDACAPVRLEPDRDEAERNGDARPGTQRRGRRAGDKQDGEQHEDEGNRSTEIRLGQDQQTEEPEEETHRPEELAERSRCGPLAEVRGGPDRDGELGEL